MTIETSSKAGLTVPNLEDLYRTNASGEHYISHFRCRTPLSPGTTPRKDGQGYLPGWSRKDLTGGPGLRGCSLRGAHDLATVK